MRHAVGSPEYKQITDIFKAVELLHRITAQLPLEDTNGANLEAPEDTGQGVYNCEDRGKGYTTVRTPIRCDYPCPCSGFATAPTYHMHDSSTHFTDNLLLVDLLVIMFLLCFVA